MEHFINNSPDKKFPKTLEISNTKGGMIWQVYHVNNLNEAAVLSKNAKANGFYGRTLIDHTSEVETFPDWRDNCNKELSNVLT